MLLKRMSIMPKLPFLKQDLQTSEESALRLPKHKEKGCCCRWFSTCGKCMRAHHRQNKEIPQQTRKTQSLRFPLRFTPSGLQCGWPQRLQSCISSDFETVRLLYNKHYHITENWTFSFLVDGNRREWTEMWWFPFWLVPLTEAHNTVW